MAQFPPQQTMAAQHVPGAAHYFQTAPAFGGGVPLMSSSLPGGVNAFDTSQMMAQLQAIDGQVWGNAALQPHPPVAAPSLSSNPAAHVAHSPSLGAVQPAPPAQQEEEEDEGPCEMPTDECDDELSFLMDRQLQVEQPSQNFMPYCM